MLQTNKPSSIVDTAEPDRPDGADGFGELVDFAVGFLLRQYPLILFVMMMVLGIGFIYLRVMPPAYTAQATIVLGREKAQFLQQQSIINDAPIDTPQLESQIQILKSKAIALSVINQLKLMEDPEYAASGPRIVQTVYESVANVFDAAPNVGGASKSKLDAVLAAFEDRLTVTRVGLSYVIEIGFSSRSPDRAAQIANAIANAYIIDQLDAKYQANRTATTWLRDRLQELSEQTSSAERAVNAFKGQNNIVAADGKLMDDQQVAELNSRLVAARAQTSEVSARLSQLNTILRSDSSDTALATSISDASTSPIIIALRQQYLELARRESEWSARYSRDHLAVVNLRNRMREIRGSMVDELRRLAETYKNEFEIAKQRQEEVEKQLEQAVAQSRSVGTAQVSLRELESSAKGYRALYDSFLQRYMGSVQQESFPITEARVISPASAPLKKSKPKTIVVIALSLFGGLGLGVGLGFLRDTMDRVFRTGAQIDSVLQMPCLALVPLVKSTKSTPSIHDPPDQLPRGQADRSNVGQRILTHNSSIFWTVVDSPLSRFAESIRSIKLAISLTMSSRPNKVVGLTSSLPNEGKSTIAAALAHLIAQVGGRVIVVDCDLRNPSLSRSFAPNATIGIVDVISGERTLEEAVWKDPKTNLVFLPAVKKTPLFHTSEILAAESTKKLFDTLRASYDYVIVDLPPIAPIVDVRATTHLVDCFVLVIEWGRTKFDVVRHAMNCAPNVHEALIGAVLNKTDMEFMKRYDNHTGSYYHDKHYARYGYGE
jgi:exopolysaccharide transport family protein